MDVLALTRELIGIESISGNEQAVADYLTHRLAELAREFGGQVERMPAAPGQENILAFWGRPEVTLSTHMDTVPPYFPLREDSDFIHGRGACDAKGIIAAMLAAVERLLQSGATNLALLFVAGEERNSAGAHAAARNPRGSRFLINGEPTCNQLALGSKGALRFEIVAKGRLAHSAYPELGDSAVHKLLNALAEIRAIPMRNNEVLGTETLNIGTIEGGRAPNVVADAAKAEIMFRLVDNPEPLRNEVRDAATRNGVEAREILFTPAVHLARFDGLPSMVAAFTTDIPAFDGKWGQPFLIGPGDIHVAHTLEERISKRELREAVEIYARMARQLLINGKEN